MRHRLTVREARKALGTTPAVFAWVLLWQDDGEYMRLTKAEVRENLKGLPGDSVLEAFSIRDDDGCIYIG